MRPMILRTIEGSDSLNPLHVVFFVAGGQRGGSLNGRSRRSKLVPMIEGAGRKHLTAVSFVPPQGGPVVWVLGIRKEE